MAKIGDVWDGTTDVLAGRAGLLAPLAVLAFVVPSVVQSAVGLYGGTSPGAAVLAVVVGLAVLVASLWGQLAVIAVASDPATTRADAGRVATARLPAALLVVLLIAAAALLLLAPPYAVLLATGYDFAGASAARSAAAMPPMAPGAALFVTLYSLAVGIALLWVSARLFLAYVVVVNERRGIGALGRSFRLTRGMTLKLIAVALLFGMVWFVAMLAVQSIVGVAFRLLLGPSQVATALLLASIAAAAVTAAFVVVVQVFAARLYAATVSREPAA